uniref:Lysine decarboxylase n=1 Tax=uncultured Bacillota bacterium TaxID=344338 RepID=A0A650EN51_9FIRM|nr:lysine decarboxylase [uncultured Firmicutes bacterium]
MLFHKDLYDSVKQFVKKDAIRFHMPGHNGGTGLSPRLKRDFFRLDVTEFEETDNLLAPQGVLKDAQVRASKVFGAGQTYFLTCGSTVGLEAMILGACPKGSSLLIDRNCHRAVISALILGEITPVFLYPEWDADNHVWRGFTRAQVERALSEHPECAGALITSPTYYGVCSEIQEIAALLHEQKKFLLVDEAHGAHFAFCDALPRTALEQGADACVQSLHKTLPAIGQSALLHIGKNAIVSYENIERSLRLLHTTSPSYPMMTGMDEAIKTMQGKGAKHLRTLIQKCEDIKTKIRILNHLTVTDEATLDCPQDALRLVIGFEKLGISGRSAAKVLQEQYGIYAEMADSHYVVFIISAGNTEKELDLLESALEELATEQPADVQPQPLDLLLPPIDLALTPSAAFHAPRERRSLSKAEGRICAELIASCPPGAAAVLPGQRLTAEVLHYLQRQEGVTELSVVKE